MENLKIKVNSAEESEEAQELFEALGYNKGFASHGNYPATIIANLKYGTAYSSRAVINNDENHADYRLVTIPQLKDMVVLHRNDINDSNVIDPDWPNSKLFLTQDDEIYVLNKEKWILSPLSGKSPVLRRLKPVTKEPVMQKEYLQQLEDGTYKLVVLDSVVDGHEGLIEVPEGEDSYWVYSDNEHYGADHFLKESNGVLYFKYKTSKVWLEYLDYRNSNVFSKAWSRHTQPEELPFVDDSPYEIEAKKALNRDIKYMDGCSPGKSESLNDLYAEIEQVRQQSIKSDGGSSAYHQREIPEYMLERWSETGRIEVKDVIRLFLNNDFTRGNIFKAHSRISSLENGMGKDGASKEYDLKKVKFFADDDLECVQHTNEDK